MNEDGWKLLTISQLHIELRDRKLRTAGNKQDLIKRLIDYDSNIGNDVYTIYVRYDDKLYSIELTTITTWAQVKLILDQQYNIRPDNIKYWRFISDTDTTCAINDEDILCDLGVAADRILFLSADDKK